MGLIRKGQFLTLLVRGCNCYDWFGVSGGQCDRNVTLIVKKKDRTQEIKQVLKALQNDLKIHRSLVKSKTKVRSQLLPYCQPLPLPLLPQL